MVLEANTTLQVQGEGGWLGFCLECYFSLMLAMWEDGPASCGAQLTHKERSLTQAASRVCGLQPAVTKIFLAEEVHNEWGESVAPIA